jgi:hypothetical protein
MKQYHARITVDGLPLFGSNEVYVEENDKLFIITRVSRSLMALSALSGQNDFFKYHMFRAGQLLTFDVDSTMLGIQPAFKATRLEGHQQGETLNAVDVAAYFDAGTPLDQIKTYCVATDKVIFLKETGNF